MGKRKPKNKKQNQNDENQNSQPQALQKDDAQNSIPPSQDTSNKKRDTDIQQPNGMQNFSAELPTPENSNSSSSDWHSGHEESYAAEVRVRTLLGSLECKGAEPSSVREEDIFRILELNEVTDVEALYKTSKERFVLIFGSEDSASKCRSMELSATSGDDRVSLLFRGKQRASTFVTIFCPEYISCRAVELAFANFGEVDRVFYGTHKFNRNLRNGKRHIRIFPTGGDPRVLPRKVTFHDGISRDVLYKGKLVNCYRCNTRHGLGEGCPEVVSREPDVALAEQRNSPCDPTPLPSKTAATDGTSAVADEHREAEVESNHESLPNQSDPESEISDSPLREEGEIESDSVSDSQESHNDPPPRIWNYLSKKYQMSFPNLPAPKPEDFERTLHRARSGVKRIHQKKLCSSMIQNYKISDSEQDCFNFAFHSAMNLLLTRDPVSYKSKLKYDTKVFCETFNWKLFPKEYEGHLINIVKLSVDLYNEFL